MVRAPTKMQLYPDMEMWEKYAMYNIETIGYLDIETSGLTADFDYMICWANYIRDVKTEKCRMEYDFIEESDFKLARKKQNADLVDRGIVGTVLDSMNQCDLLIGHWFIGKHRHDIPFIRSRCVINKVKGFPHHKQIKYGDTQKWASQLYRLHNNGLDSVQRQFDLSTEKTRLDGKVWRNACMGFRKDIKYILDHNKKDCIITHGIHLGMEEYVPIPATYA